MANNNGLESVVFSSICKYDINKWGADIHDIYKYCKEALPMPSDVNEEDFEHTVRAALHRLKDQGLVKAGAQRGYHKLTDLGRTFCNKGIDPQEINRIAEANYINKKIKDTD